MSVQGPAGGSVQVTERRHAAACWEGMGWMRGKKLEYWYGRPQGKLGFALPSHGPMETTERENHDGMGVRALVIPRASHRSDVFARAVLLMVPVLIEPQW